MFQTIFRISLQFCRGINEHVLIARYAVITRNQITYRWINRPWLVGAMLYDQSITQLFFDLFFFTQDLQNKVHNTYRSYYKIKFIIHTGVTLQSKICANSKQTTKIF
jgi:hypothetical protein